VNSLKNSRSYRLAKI